VINTPARGIGKTTVERLADHALRQGTTLVEAARAAGEIEALSRRSAKLVEKFVALYERLAAVAGGPLEEIVGHVLSETGYQKQLRESQADADQDRLANLEELLSIAREFDERHYGKSSALEAFLEEASLVNETDDWEGGADRVTLMTLHASKGLEFPVVYLTAVEEGLLPHERSRQREPDLEEERRLMFVGITRAQQELQLSMARYRDYRGQRKMSVPSSFLMELPREEMDLVDLAAGQHYAAEPPYVEPALSGIDIGPEAEAGFPWEAEPGAWEAEPGGRRPAPEAAERARAPLGVHLTTAAELAAGGRPAPPIDPDAFRQDMLVRHPEYGLGHVVALSGSGAARKATVDFPPPAGRKKLVLSKSRLRPVKGQDP
jgi:DNA helicase-2/ATP-dependent DNA helicase PcrA